MAAARLASPGPRVAPRLLRVEFNGMPYDWLNLDEMGKSVMHSEQFVTTLRENIVRYFKVPFEMQACCDEDGPLVSAWDFLRVLQSVSPLIRIFDLREMPADMKIQVSKKLSAIQTEAAKMQAAMGADAPRDLSPWRPPPSADRPTGGISSGSTWGTPQRTRGSPEAPAARPAYEPAQAAVALSSSQVPNTRPAYETSSGLGVSQLGASQLGPSQLGASQASSYAGGLGAARNAGAIWPSAGGASQPGSSAPAKPSDYLVDRRASDSLSDRRPSDSLFERNNGVSSRQASDNEELATAVTKGNSVERIQVMLFRNSGERYGFTIQPSFDNKSATIDGIDEDGVLARWNDLNPFRKVRVGDTLVEVNGQKEDLPAMEQELRRDHVTILLDRV